MTSAATPPKWRNPLQRLRNRFSHSSPAVASQIDPSPSGSHSTAKPIPSKPTSSTPSVAQSSLSSPSLGLDPGGRPVSPAGQTVLPVQQCPTAAAALSRDFLDRTLELLPQQERATVEKHILTTADDISSALLVTFNAAQDKQKLCEDKRWTFTFRGHTVRLRDGADNVMLWLDRFKQVGDIAVNVDPIHAGLPWAGIRLLLEVWQDSNYLFTT
jgi:hypothetical protein